MSNPYDRNRYGSQFSERARQPAWERARDEDPMEERNMWQGRTEDGGWGRNRSESDEPERREGVANRFDRGNPHRYSDAAYGLSEGRSRGDERGRYARDDDRGGYGGVSRAAWGDPERSGDYAHGFGPNHGFGYPSREREGLDRGYHASGYGALGGARGGASTYSPTGLDRDRLGARGEQGYGRSLGGHAGRGPKGYKRTDERICEDVCERLSRDDEVDASEIGVRVEGGEVTLEGSVETRHQKHRAEELAAEVHGVDDVHNEVRVRKGLLTELKEKVTGDEPPTGGHAGSGTKTTAGSSSRTLDHNRH